MGLQEALETERKEPAIIMQTSGEPPFDLPVQAQLETLGPRQSTVSLRPWLLDKEGSTDGPDASTTSDATGTGAAEASAGSAPADEPPDSGPVGTGDK
jgi:hypothetical protein